jgi:hypothetical protein
VTYATVGAGGRISTGTNRSGFGNFIAPKRLTAKYGAYAAPSKVEGLVVWAEAGIWIFDGLSAARGDPSCDENAWCRSRHDGEKGHVNRLEVDGRERLVGIFGPECCRRIHPAANDSPLFFTATTLGCAELKR